MQKVHNTFIKSFFWNASTNTNSCKSQYADLQRVTDATGYGTKSLLDKQLYSLGIYLPWPTSQDSSHLNLGAYDSNTFVEIFAYTSDEGPDQRFYKKLMRAHVLILRNVFWFDHKCVMHGGQLGVKSGLMVADRWCRRYLLHLQLHYCILSNAIIVSSSAKTPY